MKKTIPAPYKPILKYFNNLIFRAANDTSNFSSYPESDSLSIALKPSEDPFLDW
jgi:protein kinase A